MIKQAISYICGVILICFFGIVYANTKSLIPAVKSSLYYKMGGGEDIPLPAFYNTSYIPLNVEANVGLGFNCGAFNPVMSLKNSLNQIKSSFLSVKRQVINNATAAVTSFPLYELSRADPNLYNLLTDAMAGAQNELAISTKSCESMESEIAAGQNPYAHWGQIALGHQWQQSIGDATVSGSGDINQAHLSVSADAGKRGVPWVNASANHTHAAIQTQNSGGMHQRAIHVIHDTATAGYQVMLNNATDQKNSELQAVFLSKSAAANWIVNVVGDETITTYNGGKKSSQPGVGLYADIHVQREKRIPQLQMLVNGKHELNIKALRAVSVEDMMLSPETIQSIRREPKVVQAIIIRKLAQNLAAMSVINKARLAILVLQSGAKVPAIYSNSAAQQDITRSIDLLHQDIQDILLFVKVRNVLMSNLLSTILEAGQSRLHNSTNVSVPMPNMPVMRNGALVHS